MRAKGCPDKCKGEPEVISHKLPRSQLASHRFSRSSNNLGAEDNSKSILFYSATLRTLPPYWDTWKAFWMTFSREGREPVKSVRSSKQIQPSPGVLSPLEWTAHVPFFYSVRSHVPPNPCFVCAHVRSLSSSVVPCPYWNSVAVHSSDFFSDKALSWFGELRIELGAQNILNTNKLKYIQPPQGSISRIYQLCSEETTCYLNTVIQVQHYFVIWHWVLIMLTDTSLYLWCTEFNFQVL